MPQPGTRMCDSALGPVLLKGGCGIGTAQEVLGHEDFSTTMITPMR